MGVRLRRAFIVPDPQAWAAWGWDLERCGVQAVASPEQATLMLVPSALPPALADAVADVASRIPPGAAPMVLPGPTHLHLTPPASDGGHSDHGHGDHGGHGHGGHGHGDHEGHEGHGDMMAIVGDPSADGLIMEDVELTLGPLGAALPGGLVAKLTLDGDVVTGVALDATLRALGAPADPLTPLAWRAVLAAADRRAGADDLVAVEVERALSHVAWLRSMGSVLGLGTLDRASAEAVRLLIPARNAAVAAPSPAAERLPELIEEALSAVLRVEKLCEQDRGLRARLGGLAVVEAGELERRRIGGPAARAAGLVRDARQGDDRYDAVGFEPVLEPGSDALARTRVRAREASAALGLALELLRRGQGEVGAGWLPASVEGPRGPLHAIAARGGTPAVAAPGRAALLELAAASVAGLELSSALAGLVSFDLSPWRVGG